MDFHGLTRKELQTLCKKNKIPANMANIAMADALAALQFVEGQDELLNQSCQSQEKVAPETPSIVSRTKHTNEDSKTAQALTRTRRGTRKTADQENKNVAETPAASTCTGRRKTQLDASSVRVRTRQSVRLLEKTMAELSLKDNKARAEPVPVKMDFLDQTDVSDNVQQKNNSDDDDKKGKTDEVEPVDVAVTADDASGEVMHIGIAVKVSDETEPIDVSVTEDDASGEVMCVADKVSDEISAKLTDDVDVEADQREDQIITSKQLKIERGTDYEIIEADSNEFAADAGATDADDDTVSDCQKYILMGEAGSNQVASKESASDADADSDSHKSVANQQGVDLIADADSNQVISKESVSDADSDSHKFVANQQPVNLLAEADSSQISTESIIAAEASDESASDADADSDSHKSVASQQGVDLIADADSNQVISKESVSDADSDSHKFVANQQPVNLLAEADSSQISTESIIAAEASDVSASDTDADDDSGFQKSVADQLDIQTTAECVEKLVDVSLMETYEDEIPNSTNAEQVSPSSPENTMKNLVNVYVMPAEEIGMALPPAIAKKLNHCHLGQLTSNEADNKENIDSSGLTMIMNVESNKDMVKKKSNNIVDDESELKSLNDKSLRQLNKMLKEKLQISNNKKKNEEQNSITKKQVGNKPRPALQTLPENQMLAGGETNSEN